MSIFPFFAGFQTWIGQVDVKSSPVYFYVQRNADFNATNTPIPFDVEILNVGGAMNLTSGKFTAPRDGVYSFSFNGLAWFPASSSAVLVDVNMYLNGNFIGRGWADEVGSAGQYEAFSFQTTFNLVAGDQFWLQIYRFTTGAYIRGGFYTHFSGHLLEEKIVMA